MENCYSLLKNLFRKVFADKAGLLPAVIISTMLFFFLFASYSSFAGSTISVSATPHNASNSCNATNGSLTVTASGGNGGGKYLWTIGGPNSYTASNFGSSPVTFSGLAAGNYSVSVQDASIAGNSDSLDQSQSNFGNNEGYVNGISEWQSFIVGKTGLLTDLVFGLSSGPANNLFSGSGTLSIYAGTGMTGTLLSLQTINISNTNAAADALYIDSCHLTVPVYVSERQVFTFSLTTSTLTGQLWLATGNPYPGACDLVYSGIGSGFGYQWVFRTYVTAPTIYSDGYAGTATATIGATTGCGPITATAAALNVTACDSTNGALTINITSGGDSANSYYFNVSDGSQTASAYGPSGTTIHNLQAGTYSITVDAGGGISAIDDSVPVGDLTPHPIYNSPSYGNAWQSFLADMDGSLKQIDISFDNNYGNPGYYLTGTLSVYSGLGIGGTLLTTQSGSVTVPGGNNYNHAYADFILSNPVNITAGYEYTFEFTPTNRVDSNYYLDQTGSITGGEFFASNYVTGYAMCFTTYVTASGSNNSETVISQTISSAPLSTSVSGNVSVCPGDSAAIFASGGNSYSWRPNLGLSCDTCSHPITKPSETTTYYVTISSGSCSNTDSMVVTVANSAHAGLISAANNPVCMGNPASLTLSGNAGSLQWQYSFSGSNFIVIPGADSTAYNLQPGQTTYLRVVAESSACADTTAVYTLAVNPSPVPVLTTGDTIFCSGDSIAVCTGDTFATYLWNTGGTSYCTTASSAKDYWVTVSNTYGCSAVSSHKAIAVYSSPSVSIIRDGDTLSSQGQVAYQWLLNGGLLTGDTSPMVVAKEQGSYTLQITDSNGCTAISNAVLVNGIENLLEQSVSLYPNPSVSSWQLTVNSSLVGSAMEVFDEQGRLVWNSEIRNQKSEIQLQVASGVYYLRISNANGNVVKKMVKI